MLPLPASLPPPRALPYLQHHGHCALLVGLERQLQPLVQHGLPMA